MNQLQGRRILPGYSNTQDANSITQTRQNLVRPKADGQPVYRLAVSPIPVYLGRLHQNPRPILARVPRLRRIVPGRNPIFPLEQPGKIKGIAEAAQAGRL